MKMVTMFILTILLLSCNKIPEKNTSSQVIITSPEIAELAAYIAPEKILAVTAECNYPELLIRKPKVGKFGEINIERIISLNPDLVITSGMEQDILSEKLNNLGIKNVKLYLKNLDDMINIISTLGDIFHEKDKALSLADSLKSELLYFLHNKPEASLKVYIEIYNDPIMTVSDNSLVGDILRHSGLRNSFPVLPREYCEINQEEVINADPDVIIITYEGITIDDVCQRKGWSAIKAIKNKRILTTADINPDWILRATPRTIQGINQIRELCYEK